MAIQLLERDSIDRLIDYWHWRSSERCQEVKVLFAQLCPTLYNLVDYSLPGSSVHRILQARILECVAVSFSRRSSWPRGWILVSCIAGRFFTVWATREMSGDSDKKWLQKPLEHNWISSMMYHEILPLFESHNNIEMMVWAFGECLGLRWTQE